MVKKLLTWSVGLSALLVVVAGINVVLSARLSRPRQPAAAAPPKPSRLQLTVIADATCTDCWSIEPVVAAISKQNVTVERSNLDRSEARAVQLVQQYGITKLPMVVITGELDQDAALKALWPKVGDRVGEAVVYRGTLPPYVEPATGAVKGRVTVTLVTDTTCATCYDVNKHRLILSQFGIRDTAATTVDVRSAEGKKLRQTYQLRNVPTFLLQGEVGEYVNLDRIWPQVGSIEADGTYVFRNGVPDMGTYRDLKTGAVVKPTPTPTPRPTATPAPSPAAAASPRG